VRARIGSARCRAAWVAACGATIGLAAAAAAQAAPDPVAGGATFRARCAICHAIVGQQTKVGPSLAGIVGRPAGKAPGARYSAALGRADFRWTPARLDAFLADPAAVVPGTAMAVRLADPAQRADVVAYLATLK